MFLFWQEDDFKKKAKVVFMFYRNSFVISIVLHLFILLGLIIISEVPISHKTKIVRIVNIEILKNKIKTPKQLVLKKNIKIKKISSSKDYYNETAILNLSPKKDLDDQEPVEMQKYDYFKLPSNLTYNDLKGAFSEKVDFSEGIINSFSYDEGTDKTELKIEDTNKIKKMPPSYIKKKKYYSPNELTKKPSIINLVKPHYPEKAKSLGIEGKVILEVDIDENGVIKSIKIIKSVGYGLDESAIETVKQYKFSPGEINGIKVPVKILLPINFQLRL